MAGVKSGVSQASCSAAARVFARFSACKVRFSGRMPALSATGTEPDGPNAAESHNRAGVRTVRLYAHAPLRLQGSPCPAHVGSGRGLRRLRAVRGRFTAVRVRAAPERAGNRRRAHVRMDGRGRIRPARRGKRERERRKPRRFRKPAQGAPRSARLDPARKMLAAALLRGERISLVLSGPARQKRKRA